MLDSGEREAFKRGHWPGAVNIPLDELAFRGSAAPLHGERRSTLDWLSRSLRRVPGSSRNCPECP